MDKANHYKNYDTDAMIKVCLTCPKKKCPGECNRVRTAEKMSSVKKYKYREFEYSLAELSQLTGYTHKGVKKRLKNPNFDINNLLRPSNVTCSSKLYECFGLQLRISDWAELLGTSNASLGRRLKNGFDPQFVFRAYMKGGRKIQMDKFKAKFVSGGQPHPFAHKYTNYEIYTQENVEETVNWAFENLCTRRVPEMNEWLKNLNDPNSDISPDYYFKGYYQISKEDYGYYFTIVEPFTD